MRNRRRGIAGLIVAFLLVAIVAVWWVWPSAAPVEVDVAKVVTPKKQRRVAQAPPARKPQTLPISVLDPSPDEPVLVARMRERAEWADTGLVWCDVSRFATHGENMMGGEFDRMISSEGSVDPYSRLFVPIHNGEVLISVTKADAEARFFLARTDEMTNDEEGHDAVQPDDVDGPRRGRRNNMDWLTIRWSGAEPGETVACDGVWSNPTGELLVTIVDDDGDPWDEPGSGDMVMARGCGFLFHPKNEPIRVPAGPCVLQTMRRLQMFPFIMNKGPPIEVTVRADDLTTVELHVPPPPTSYMPPDIDEMAVAADILAFMGSDKMADMIDDAIESAINGDFGSIEDLVMEWARRQRGGHDLDDELDEVEEIEEEPDYDDVIE